MKSALVLEEQSRQKLKLQGHPHISPPSLLPPQEQSLEDISPKWARRLKNENIPTYMSLTWLRWRYELQKASKCVVGEAYGYSSKYVEDCDEGDRIGCRFLYYFSFNWHSKLERNKQEFVKHWSIAHSQYERPFLHHPSSIAFNTIPRIGYLRVAIHCSGANALIGIWVITLNALFSIGGFGFDSILPFPYDLISVFGLCILVNVIRGRRIMKRYGCRRNKRPVRFIVIFKVCGQPLRYYCINCGKEHIEIACPNCGSKMKRIG